ncbi:MFS transporter [Xenorhabdus sp. 12]|uniref:MFS transporter n=1 Tax=Xenorhabdus santafensis TaxID=2582833 RepID=A0ABU4SCT0_9GAMM|nr:MFS transporter [Xenorhabdus sp. 12]MDX7988608.1 MFS transporter [Xenorhabdus sp. 12]
MKILLTLKNKTISRLWSAMTLASIGAEIYAFAIVWIATERFGSQAGYLISLQAAVMIIAALTAGMITEGFSSKSMMLLSDLVRFIVTLLPFISWLLTGSLPTSLLIAAIVVTSYFRPVFDPAMMSVLPGISTDRSLLQATNGLFDIVRRIARVAGPTIAAYLFTKMPIYNFFAFNAATYLVSAIFILSVSRELNHIHANQPRAIHHGSFISRNIAITKAGFKALNQKSAINYHLIAYAICNSGWYISLVVGLALKVRQDFPDKSEYFGYILGIYGLFNVLSNLVVSEVRISKPIRAMSIGRFLSGCALFCMAFSNSIGMMMLFAAIASIGAPITQIPLATLMQTHFQKQDIDKVFRCRLFYEQLFILLVLLIAPKLIEIFSLHAVMVGSSLPYIILGALGFFITREMLSEK